VLRQGVMRVLVVVAALAATAPISAQTPGGQVTGTVISQETRQPLGAVQVYLDGTGRASITRTDGSFTITNVPPGTYTLVAQSIGFQPFRQAGVAVTAGTTTTLNVELITNVLALQEVVATGLVDPVEGARSPITVNRINREIMPITAAGSAVQNLAGRVPGVNLNSANGQPGGTTSLMLRTPTSARLPGNPMIVVDGVILGENTSNIESLDIESIEVIKGAAAASLYGSRAAAGVIAITTARGQGLAAGETQFTARSEVGRTGTIRSVDRPSHHHFRVDNPSNPTTYVDATGNPVGRNGRVPEFIAPGISFMDKAYPDPVFDNLNNVFQPGNYQTHSFNIAQNSESTNFAVMLNRRVEEGALLGSSGYEQNSVRVNLDHRFLNAFTLGVSAYHSRDHRDNAVADFPQIYNAPVDVDLTARDGNGEFVRVMPGAAAGSAFLNPLWFQTSRENERRRARTLGNGNLRWTPQSWVTLSANVSYDRSDAENRVYVPLGTPLNAINEDQSGGSLRFDNDVRNTINADAQISLRRDFGPLNARTTVRGVIERDEDQNFWIQGQNFFVGAIPDISAAADKDGESQLSEIRSTGFLWDNAFDYEGKYILTVLGRRDGSSLFGPDNRWHNYYRVAGAYRLSEEPWFNLPNVDEFKISYARGTAGGRPGFNAQYETWLVGPTGVSKLNLGNRELRPEHTLEQEVSLDMILFNRFGVDLTHAWQRTTEQLVPAPVLNVTGFGTQWQNGGTVTGHTTELIIEAQVMRTPEFQWTTNVVADRSRGRIEDWPYPCDATLTWRYYCTGVGIYDIYGGRFVRSHAELESHRGGTAVPFGDQFQVNDEGYLVWVGEGNTFQDGIAKNLWGTSSPLIGGRTYAWGMPFLDQTADGVGRRQKIGDGSHINLGFINNFNYRGVAIHTQLHAALGGDAINRSHQEMALQQTYHAMDQSGRPDGLKKPVAYYTALEGGTGNDAWMEDGTYLKLRTVGVNYTFRQPQLARVGLSGIGMQTVTLGLIGRNIFTVTNYSGFDPEQALNFNDRLNQDRFQYPNTRNYTAEIQVTF
jgi:TonB-linked SusC/RagA family outer membrane protein